MGRRFESAIRLPLLRSSEVPILAAFLRPSFVLRLSAKHDGEAGDAPRNAERCVASRLLPFAFAFCPSPFAFRLSPFAFRPLPFALCPSPFALRLSKLQRRGGKIKHLGQTMPCGPRFSFAPAFYRIGNQLHSGSAPRLASGPIFCAWGGGLGEIGGGCGWSKWSFGHLVKIDFGQTENATIIIKIYIFIIIVSSKRTSKTKMTKMTLTTLTTFNR